MAVFTKLTKEEITAHLAKYDLGELVAFEEILAGIDNSNFILHTKKGNFSGKFILTIFEKRIDPKDLPFFINFKLHLAEKNIPVPAAIASLEGETLVDLKEKKSAIVTFLKGGEAKNIEANHCFEVGKMLAKMHIASNGFEGRRENDLGAKHWRNLFNKFANLLDSYQLGLKEEILQNLDFLESSWRFDLPSGAAHLDLFPDNVFFDEKNHACAAIDFYFAANDLLIYDFAIAVVAWCDSEEKFLAIFEGYEEVRKLSENEKDFLKIALVGASMRFLLTRLHDMFFTPKNSFVKIKDPQEYLHKLRFFKSNL